MIPRPYMCKLNPSTTHNTAYPFKRIETCIRLSDLAYQDPANMLMLEDVLEGYPKFIEHDHTQAYLWKFKDPNVLFLAFRGTECLEDVMDDVDIRLTHVKNSQVFVHNGFLRQYKSLEDDILKELKKEEPSANPHIVCCGHSSGGALATLGAVLLSEQLGEAYVFECYTIGAPRVGNVAFCDLFNAHIKSNALRIVNANDPVPMVPITHCYCHVIPAIVIDDSGDVYEVTADMPWYIRPFYATLNLDFKHLILDHQCMVYAHRIKVFASILQSMDV